MSYDLTNRVLNFGILLRIVLFKLKFIQKTREICFNMEKPTFFTFQLYNIKHCLFRSMIAH